MEIDRTGADEILVDSNFFVALFNEFDTLHQNAIPIAKQWESEQLPFVITNVIFLEIVTVLSQRMGRKTATRAGDDLLTHPLLRVIHIDEMLHEESWRIFKEIEAKEVSFVDSSIIAVIKSENIPTLLTFDTQHFKALAKSYRLRLYPIHDGSMQT